MNFTASAHSMQLTVLIYFLFFYNGTEINLVFLLIYWHKTKSKVIFTVTQSNMVSVVQVILVTRHLRTRDVSHCWCPNWQLQSTYAIWFQWYHNKILVNHDIKLSVHHTKLLLGFRELEMAYDSYRHVLFGAHCHYCVGKKIYVRFFKKNICVLLRK